MKRARFGIPIALALVLAHTVSYASIEWPVLYSMRAVGFTASLVRECNLAFPVAADARIAALARWQSRNEAIAVATRDFNLQRARRGSPQLDLAAMEAELDALEKSALSQAKRAGSEWQRMCTDMPRWLESEESDVARQVPDFMRAKVN